ncbi:DUF4177 domain-containing protein [Paracoccus sp. 11-3]|uniref:DUF4177 domain-containing protein n=1 Tax=Paracoccus amoyensis TaxID=2760093 RepID=A0A926GGX7_9RHOB|nr:DUF4177 domain-containing protein [Paracoccus amoyensis]MBC9247079.1 DUF4177 domain-containing protein [Paracoccus amoyensis]
MTAYEYNVIPAPNRGEKDKDAKTPSDRYAVAFTAELNRMAQDGWEYIRADVLPSEERTGLTGRSTVYHNLLVFRRLIASSGKSGKTVQHATPQPEYPVAASPVRQPEPVPDAPAAAAPQSADRTVAAEQKPAVSVPQGNATPPAPRSAPADN